MCGTPTAAGGICHYLETKKLHLEAFDPLKCILAIKKIKITSWTYLLGGYQSPNKRNNSYSLPKVNCVKAYKKVLNRSIDKGTFLINHNCEYLTEKQSGINPKLFEQL